MKDDLTDKVAAAYEVDSMPFASKVSIIFRATFGHQPDILQYIAYGKLAEVMPFLGRRAIENKSVMSGEGGAAAERARLSAELWRRMFG